MPQDMYRLLALDEDISDRQRQQRDRRAELIAPLLAEECICDKSYRNRVLREIVSVNSVSRKTVLQYLWLYWVYQSKNALLPSEKSNAEKRPLSTDEKAIRWALNKFYYTPQKQSLQTSYKMMLRSKYCDAKGKLKQDYPSFWQFRYFSASTVTPSVKASAARVSRHTSATTVHLLGLSATMRARLAHT